MKKLLLLPIILMIICASCNQPSLNTNVPIIQNPQNQMQSQEENEEEENCIVISKPKYDGVRTLLLISQFYGGEIESMDYCLYDPIEKKFYNPDIFKRKEMDSFKQYIFSEDGNRRLSMEKDLNYGGFKINVIGLKDNDILFSKSYPVGNYLPCQFSPMLTSYVEKNEDGYYFNRIKDVLYIKLPIEQNINLDGYNLLISYDDNYVAYIYKDNNQDYLCIIDVRERKLLCNVKTDHNITYLCQFHNNGRLLYNSGGYTYIIDHDGKNKAKLGKYKGKSILSPDGKTLAYSQVENVDEENCSEHTDEYQLYDIYIYDMVNNIREKLPMPTGSYELIEQWVDIEAGILYKETQ